MRVKNTDSLSIYTDVTERRLEALTVLSPVTSAVSI